MQYHLIPKFTGYNDLTQTVDNVLLPINEMPSAKNVDFTREFGAVTKDWGQKKIGSGSISQQLNGSVSLITEGDMFFTEKVNKRMIVAGTTLYQYCPGDFLVPVASPFTAGNYVDFTAYNNVFYFADGVGNIQTWDGGIGTSDLTLNEEELIDDDCANDNTDDWDTGGTGALAFDTNHYEFASSAVSDYFFYNTDLSVVLPYCSKYTISFDIKDGTQASGTVAVATLDSDKAVVSSTNKTSTASWVTHSIEVTPSSTDTYFGFVASADWSGSNIEIRNIKISPTFTWSAKRIAIYKNRLMIADTTESGSNFPSRVRYSKAGDPTTWGVSDAIDVTTTSGDKIIRMIPLYDNLIVFKENSVHVVYFVGGDLPFGTQTLDERVTNIAPWSIAKTQDGLVFLSEEGLFVCDGESVQPHPQAMKIQGILDSLYIASLDQCYGASSDILHQYWLSVPIKGSSTCNYILVYDWKFQTWKVIERATTCMGFFTQDVTGTWSDISTYTWQDIQSLTWDSSDLYSGSKFTVFGDSSGYVRKSFPGYNNDGSAYIAEGETGWIDCGSPHLVKDFLYIQPRWNGTSGTSMTVQYKCDYESNWQTVTTSETLSTSQTMPKLSTRRSGRRIKYKFSNATANDGFTIYDAIIHYDIRSDRK